MKHLANELVFLLVEEYGAAAFLRRLSDPYWFQGFGCLLGFDWHSSIVTTVVTRILREVLGVIRPAHLRVVAPVVD